MLLNHNSNRLKIIDFGLSRYLCAGEECRELLGTPEFVGESHNPSNTHTLQNHHPIVVIQLILL